MTGGTGTSSYLKQFIVEQQVKSGILYLDWLKEYSIMFRVLRFLLFVFCILKPSIARLKISDLKNCKEGRHESKMCLTGEDGYLKPFPVIVDTDLILRNLIEIDENKNSISAQFELWTGWEDPGIALSNISLG